MMSMRVGEGVRGASGEVRVIAVGPSWRHRGDLMFVGCRMIRSPHAHCLGAGGSISPHFPSPHLAISSPHLSTPNISTQHSTFPPSGSSTKPSSHNNLFFHQVRLTGNFGLSHFTIRPYFYFISSPTELD